jgi:predicted regulator of Ras-like GTPase activity (Roadblock/LC7/MglB family)
MSAEPVQAEAASPASMLPAHRNPAVQAAGHEALAEMRDLCTSLVYAAIVTDDGFDVVRLPGARMDSGRFASMSSSMQALGDAVARELRMGPSQYLIIGSENAHVVQLRVPDHPLVLSALFDDEETVGKALAISRTAAAKLTSTLATPTA